MISLVAALVIVLPIILGLIPVLSRVRHIEKVGPRWINLTSSGRLLLALALATVILTVFKLIFDNIQKEQSEAKVQSALKELGLELSKLNDKKDTVRINNINILNNRIGQAGLRQSDQKQTPGPIQFIPDTVYIDRPDTFRMRIHDTIYLQSPQPEKPKEPQKQEDIPIVYVTSTIDKTLRDAGDSHHQTFAKIIFVNNQKFNIYLYHGGTSQGGPGTVPDYQPISAGKSAETNSLFIGYEDYNVLQQPELSYIFYFYGVDENHRQVFGTWQHSLKPYMVYTVKLDPTYMPMTPEWKKDVNALHRNGINVQ